MLHRANWESRYARTSANAEACDDHRCRPCDGCACRLFIDIALGIISFDQRDNGDRFGSHAEHLSADNHSAKHRCAEYCCAEYCCAEYCGCFGLRAICFGGVPVAADDSCIDQQPQ